MAHPMSPRKTTSRSKRPTDSNATLVSRKRSKTFADDTLGSQPDGASESAPRRSNRSGAGSGGRNSQMEKIEAALESQFRKPRSPTDLPEDILENPLAPERRQKGRREKRQVCHLFIYSKDELTLYSSIPHRHMCPQPLRKPRLRRYLPSINASQIPNATASMSLLCPLLPSLKDQTRGLHSRSSTILASLPGRPLPQSRTR